MRVCYFGTYRAEYSRNKIMIEGLRRNGVQVIECHEALWSGIEDRVQAASGGWRKPSFWWRVLRTYAALLWRYIQTAEHDVLVVGYPGQIDVYVARLLSWLRGKPLVWDVFMSIYLIALERGLEQRSAFTINGIRCLERWALRLPDLLIHDTQEYAQWLSQTHNIDISRFRLVATGADDRIFQPSPKTRSEDGMLQVLYYGTFIPNHGVKHIIEAAQFLKDKQGIKFELIGDGPDRQETAALAQQYQLDNVHFADWQPPAALVQHAAQADICLGAFGQTPQSLMTVQNKIYETLAMGKALITGDSQTARQVLQHGQHAYLCQRNAAAIADAIRTLEADPTLRQTLSQNGYHLFTKQFTIARLGELYRKHLLTIIKTRKPDPCKKEIS